MIDILLNIFYGIALILATILVCGFSAFIFLKLFVQIQQDYFDICATKRYKKEYIESFSIDLDSKEENNAS